MELTERFKGYGVIVTYADGGTDFGKGDKFDTIDEFVEELRFTQKVNDLRFEGIKPDDDGEDYVAVFRETNIGYRNKIYFKLVLDYNREMAKAIEEMV